MTAEATPTGQLLVLKLQAAEKTSRFITEVYGSDIETFNRTFALLVVAALKEFDPVAATQALEIFEQVNAPSVKIPRP